MSQEQKEYILYLDSNTLKKKLGLPEDAVIITVFEQIAGNRSFCVRYSTKEVQK